MAKLPDIFISESKHVETNGSFQGLQAEESDRSVMKSKESGLACKVHKIQKIDTNKCNLVCFI